MTGGRGYLGRLVVASLAERGVPVVSVDVRPPEPGGAPAESVVEHTADVRSPELAELVAEHRPASVVHLAAILNPRPDQDEREVADVEVGGARRVLEACAESGVRHLVVASSGAAYGYHPENVGALLDEEAPLRGHPTFLYSRHKAKVEELLGSWRREHPELAQLVLRPGTILGSGTRNQITALFDAPVVLGLRGAEIPFVLVWDTDVAEIVATGVTEQRSGIYNVAGEGAVTMREVARRRGRPYVALPPALVRGALSVLKPLRVVPYGPEQIDFLRYRPVLDASRLRRDFPGLPRLGSSEVLDRYLESRRG